MTSLLEMKETLSLSMSWESWQIFGWIGLGVAVSRGQLRRPFSKAHDLWKKQDGGRRLWRGKYVALWWTCDSWDWEGIGWKFGRGSEAPERRGMWQGDRLWLWHQHKCVSGQISVPLLGFFPWSYKLALVSSTLKQPAALTRYFSRLPFWYLTC